MKMSYRVSGDTFFRLQHVTEAKRLFFLSVEGASTEPSYFWQLNANLKKMGCYDAAIHVLERADPGKSGPQDVYDLLEACSQLRDGEQLIRIPGLNGLKKALDGETLLRLLSDDVDIFSHDFVDFRDRLLQMGVNWDYRQYLQSQPSKRDHFVVVLDRDKHNHTQQCLQDIIAKCRSKKFMCCLTNPCFEFWLLLHLVDVDELLTPTELAKIEDNRKVSKKHTHVSKRVSEIAGHAKEISAEAFEQFYGKEPLEKARAEAKRFARSNRGVLTKVGTTIPNLMKKLFG